MKEFEDKIKALIFSSDSELNISFITPSNIFNLLSVHTEFV